MIDSSQLETTQLAISKEFRSQFQAVPRLFRAPGRVNLIGEHTDYNQGFVLPMAIGYYTWVAASPRDDGKIVAQSKHFGERREMNLAHWAPETQKHWSNYVFGVVRAFEKHYAPLRGANLLIHGNVPIGAGLSSSASLEVATGLALASLSEFALNKTELARICQYAENEYAGMQCGIMDQYVSAHARERSALLLDCRSLEHQFVSLPDQVCIVICNTMVKHELTASGYNIRRSQCEQCVQVLRTIWPELQSLRDVSMENLERYQAQLPRPLLQRCRHVVLENGRTLAAAAALQSKEVAKFGELMIESHRSLRDDYEVSCPELDLMVEIANRAPGCLGARMTGGGFGGCTVNLVQRECVQEFVRNINIEYQTATGFVPETYVSAPADGAIEIIQAPM